MNHGPLELTLAAAWVAHIMRRAQRPKRRQPRKPNLKSTTRKGTRNGRT